MSLKRRFLFLALLSLTLVAALEFFINHQMNEIQSTRKRLQEDWVEIRLLFEVQSGFSHIHNLFESGGDSADLEEISKALKEIETKIDGLKAEASKHTAGEEQETFELDAGMELERNVRQWKELLRRHKQVTPGDIELLRQINAMHDTATQAVTRYSVVELGELDESLESLDAREEILEETASLLTLGLITVLGLTWFGLTFWLLRPVKQLHRMVKRMADHRFKMQPVPHGKDEIGDLFDSFFEMATSIRNFTKVLEKKVQERTKQLEDSRAQLSQMLDELPDAVALVDVQADRVLLCNAPWRELFGQTHDGQVLQIMTGKPENDGQYKLTDAGGNRCLVNVQRHILAASSAGTGPVALEHIRDVTLQVRTHAALVSSQQLASIGRLSAGLAHEINNPLTAIAACAEGLIKRSREHDSASGEYLRIIQEEAFRCKEITGKLMDASRQGDVQLSWFSPAEVVRDVVRLTDSLAARSEVIIVNECEESGPLHSSPRTIRQILLNLILNAVEACPPGGRITLRTRAVEEWFFIEVLDNGRGLSTEDLGSLFEPFFSRRRDGTGTGLGLFVCQALAQALGGTIEAHSDGIGAGARFSLKIPLSAPSEPEHVDDPKDSECLTQPVSS